MCTVYRKIKVNLDQNDKKRNVWRRETAHDPKKTTTFPIKHEGDNVMT